MWGEKCKGGFVSEALEFGRYSNLARDDFYPYQERDGICRQRGLEIYPETDRHWRAKFMPFWRNPDKKLSVGDDLDQFKEQVRVEKFYKVKSHCSECMIEALNIGPVSTVVNAN